MKLMLPSRTISWKAACLRNVMKLLHCTKQAAGGTKSN